MSSQIWCYLKFKRWRVILDEEIKKISLQTYVKLNLVLYQIWEMKRKKVRWRDEKEYFLVWTYIKPNLVKMTGERKTWRDEKNIIVPTYFKPNLVLSQTQEMTGEMKTWRDEKNIIVPTYFKPNLVLSQIWDEEWDEEMKKKYFRSNLVLSQIWEMKNKKKRWRIFFSPNTCQAKSDVISSSRDEEWDEEMKKISLQKYVKPYLVLSHIWEIKRWRVRWRDEKNFQKKIFWVQTYIKPNLILSQISLQQGVEVCSKKLQTDIQAEKQTLQWPDKLLHSERQHDWIFVWQDVPSTPHANFPYLKAVEKCPSLPWSALFHTIWISLYLVWCSKSVQMFKN